MTYKSQPVSTSSVILIITLLVTSVTNQIFEFAPSLNNTIYIEVCIYICCNFHFSCWLLKYGIALQSYKCYFSLHKEHTKVSNIIKIGELD